MTNINTSSEAMYCQFLNLLALSYNDKPRLNINDLPTEILDIIFSLVPEIGNAGSILRVCKKWYVIYNAFIQLNQESIFDKILYSHSFQWGQYSVKHAYHFGWPDFIAKKLIEFCRPYPSKEPEAGKLENWETWNANYLIGERLINLEREECRLREERAKIDELFCPYIETYTDAPSWLHKKYRNHLKNVTIVRQYIWVVEQVSEYIVNYF
jgi:hypothetical protein